MRLQAVSRRTWVILGIVLFSLPGLSVTPEPLIAGTKGATASVAGLGQASLPVFGVRIAGMYVVSRRLTAGTSRILTIFADGNLTSTQSIQFGRGAAGGGFSSQQGVWKRVGERAIEAKVLDLSYDQKGGAFLGIAIADYRLQFDPTFQTVTGTATGKVFKPGVDPLNSGDSIPISKFSDTFQAQRVK